MARNPTCSHSHALHSSADQFPQLNAAAVMAFPRLIVLTQRNKFLQAVHSELDENHSPQLRHIIVFQEQEILAEQGDLVCTTESSS